MAPTLLLPSPQDLCGLRGQRTDNRATSSAPSCLAWQPTEDSVGCRVGQVQGRRGSGSLQGGLTGQPASLRKLSLLGDLEDDGQLPDKGEQAGIHSKPSRRVLDSSPECSQQVQPSDAFPCFHHLPHPHIHMEK